MDTLSNSLLKRCKCTRDEKKELISLIHFILELRSRAEYDGLSSLKDQIYPGIDPLLEEGIRAISANDPGALSFSSIFIADTLKDVFGLELLKRLIIVRGFLGIYNAHEADILLPALLSLLGEDRDLYQKAFERKFLDFDNETAIELLIQEISRINYKSSGDLQAWFLWLSEDQINYVLSWADVNTLATALSHSSELVLRKVSSYLEPALSKDLLLLSYKVLTQGDRHWAKAQATLKKIHEHGSSRFSVVSSI